MAYKKKLAYNTVLSINISSERFLEMYNTKNLSELHFKNLHDIL
jgi:hypothetical protein